MNITWTGSGPTTYNPETGKSEEIHTEREQKDDENPYNILGYGWGAYFSTLKVFAILFTLLTLIMIPVFKFYADEGGLKLVSHGYYNSVFMLGNVGFSKAVCESTYT